MGSSIAVSKQRVPLFPQLRISENTCGAALALSCVLGYSQSS